VWCQCIPRHSLSKSREIQTRLLTESVEDTHKCPCSVWRRYSYRHPLCTALQIRLKRPILTWKLGAFVANCANSLPGVRTLISGLTDVIRQKSLEILWSRTIYAHLVSVRCNALLFCDQKNLPIQNPPHPPDLAPCDLCLFLIIKTRLTVHRVSPVGEIQQRVQQTFQIGIAVVLQPTAVQR
jgi:hypothetical protein